MARKYVQIKRYSGLSDSEKEGLQSQYLWGRSIDYRSDPTKLTILPRTTKNSGTVVVDLVKWMDRYSRAMKDLAVL
jgi:penicillin V acylase-like amidase (Ntn superfamily)